MGEGGGGRRLSESKKGKFVTNFSSKVLKSCAKWYLLMLKINVYIEDECQIKELVAVSDKFL